MSEHFIERSRYLCALGGASSTVTALPETVAILHAAAGCAGNLAWTQNGGSGLQVGGYCGPLATPSSNVTENEVVFGGEDRLREEIANTIKVMDAKLFVVLTGCVTEVIGDDIKSAVSDFREEGITIIGAETGGFRGNSYVGYDLVLQALFRDFVARGTEKAKGTVNLWGIAPYLDPFWRGNLEGVRALLELLGLRVNSLFTQADTLEDLRLAAGAELNVVVSDLYGIKAARTFQEVHGTPFINVPLPVGPTASAEFLRRVSEALNRDTQRTEEVICEQRKSYYSFLDPLTDCYNDLDLQRFAVVVGDGNYSIALTRFLADDLGWLPELVVCTDQVIEEEKEMLKNRLERLDSGLSPRFVFETDTSEIINHLNRHWPRPTGGKYHNAFSPAFVLGSSLDRGLATAIGAAHLSVSFPVSNRAVLDRGYTGYRGGLRLMEDLIGAIVVNR